MNYVDGFVASVPDSQREAYREHAAALGAVFKRYGALQVVDAWGNDVPEGKLTSFPMAVKREAGESVVLGWVVWPSKAVRDEAWQKMESDEAFGALTTKMPFDGKRMIYGGFEIIAES